MKNYCGNSFWEEIGNETNTFNDVSEIRSYMELNDETKRRTFRKVEIYIVNPDSDDFKKPEK